MQLLLNSSSKEKEELSRTLLENFKLSQSEIFSDDLSRVICKVCGKPKYILQWSPLCRKDRYVLVDGIGCDCMREAERARYMEKHSSKLVEVFNTEPHLRSLGDMFKDKKFESLDPDLGDGSFWDAEGKLASWCVNYKPGNKGFSITGGIGIGKTTLAACVRNALLWYGYTCVVATGRQIDEDISAGFSCDSMSYNTYKTVDVLIIDDLGADIDTRNPRKSGSFNASMFDVINSRYVAGMTTCYTTNMGIDEMVSIGMDKRYLDRLTQMVEDRLFITGKSVREVI